VGLLAVTQATTWRMEQPSGRGAPALALPATLEGGWLATKGNFVPWTPAYLNPSRVAEGVYRSGDTEVGVWVGYYRDQGYERKLVTSTNMLVEVPSYQWAVVEHGRAALASGAPASLVGTALLRHPSDPKATATARLQVAHVYWVGGRYTTSEAQAKLYIALNRLMGRGDDSAIVIFYTSQGEQPRAEPVLHRFVGEQLGRIGTLLAAAAADTRKP
jgi:EpsI family protein